MCVEKYRELGPDGYQEWRAEQVAMRRIRRPAEVIIQDRIIEIRSEPEIIEIPRFLAPDPITEFIEAERYDHESIEAARSRLWLELEILLNRAKGGPLPDMEEARKRTLTSGLKGVN
jgi:hypothetical protein